MRGSWSSAVALFAVLAGTPARAQPAGTEVRRNAVGVRLVVPPDSLAARYFHGGSFVPGPLNPSTAVPVGAQAREAYAAAVQRLFEADPAHPAAELVVRIASSDVQLDRDGWFASVEHEIALREPSGVEIARWRVRGEGRIVGLGGTAIPAAFRRAAEYAAQTFAAEFGTDPAARDWLSTRGIAPRPDSRPLAAPPRLIPTPRPVVRARGRELLFAEMGGSAVGAGDALSSAFSIRAGWSGRVMLLLVTFDAWPRPFVAYPPSAWGSGDGHVDTYSLGMDVGVQKRLGSRFEVQAGAGAAALAARASARYTPLSAPRTWTESSETAFGFAGSVFGAARFNAVLPRTAIRYRFGVELRKLFGARVDMPDMGREITVADLSAGVFLGVELPWGAPSGGDEPATGTPSLEPITAQ